jgi:hypothetical protein
MAVLKLRAAVHASRYANNIKAERRVQLQYAYLAAQVCSRKLASRLGCELICNDDALIAWMLPRRGAHGITPAGK